MLSHNNVPCGPLLRFSCWVPKEVSPHLSRPSCPCEVAPTCLGPGPGPGPCLCPCPGTLAHPDHLLERELPSPQFPSLFLSVCALSHQAWRPSRDTRVLSPPSPFAQPLQPLAVLETFR